MPSKKDAVNRGLGRDELADAEMLAKSPGRDDDDEPRPKYSAVRSQSGNSLLIRREGYGLVVEASCPSESHAEVVEEMVADANRGDAHWATNFDLAMTITMLDTAPGHITVDALRRMIEETTNRMHGMPMVELLRPVPREESK